MFRFKCFVKAKALRPSFFEISLICFVFSFLCKTNQSVRSRAESLLMEGGLLLSDHGNTEKSSVCFFLGSCDILSRGALISKHSAQCALAVGQIYLYSTSYIHTFMYCI